MDTWGYVIGLIGFAMWFITKKQQAVWLLLGGIGIGILIGTYGSYPIVMRILG